MKTTHRRFLLYLAIILSTAFIFSACSKSNNSTASGSGNFSWLHNSTNHSTNLDTAFVSGSGLIIPPLTLIAGYPRPSYSYQVRVQLTLTSFNVGNYAITPGFSAPNRLAFEDDAGNDLSGVSGTLSITANDGNFLTGNFTTTVMDASSVTSQLTGSFSKMPIRP